MAHSTVCKATAQIEQVNKLSKIVNEKKTFFLC